jgi:hypothetical protein
VQKGRGFSGGIKPLKLRYEANLVFYLRARAEEKREIAFATMGEEKNSEERSPRALGVEKDPQGTGKLEKPRRG